MRYLTLFLALILAACNTAAAQPGTEPEAAQADPAPAAAATPPQIYIVELSEYRLKSRFEDDLTASEIVERLAQLKRDGEVDTVETLLLSALEGKASFVHFSKKSAVTVGVVQAGPGREVRQTEERSAETQFELLAKPEGEKTRIQAVYRASRLGEDGTEISPPSTSAVSIETTLLLEFEKPVLIGATDAETPTYITLTIHR